MIFKPVLFALVPVLLSAPAFASDTWKCDVEKFNGFSGDKEFARKNRAKIFEITKKGKKITVTSSSKHFNTSSKVFTVFQSDSFSDHGKAKSRVSLSVISLPKRPDSKIAQDGYFNAVTAVISSVYNNTWLLRCK